MRTSKIAILAALGLAASAYSAQAACNVTATTIASHIASGAHTETDCASAADVTVLQGIAVTHGTDIAALQTGKADVTYVDSQNAAQDTIINQKADTTYVDSQNGAQDAVIATKASTAYVDGQNAAQDTVIATKASTTYVNSQNAIQDNRLNSFNGTGGSLETWASGVDSTLNAHGAMLSDHAVQLGKIHGTLSEHAKGIAIATAIPDAWLSDKESFAIAGGIGGFGDETALGLIAIGRIDNTWSLNAGLGADTEFKEFGWKAGVRAGW